MLVAHTVWSEGAKISQRRLAQICVQGISIFFVISGRNVLLMLYKTTLLSERNSKDNDFVQKSQNMTE